MLTGEEAHAQFTSDILLAGGLRWHSKSYSSGSPEGWKTSVFWNLGFDIMHRLVMLASSVLTLKIRRLKKILQKFKIHILVEKENTWESVFVWFNKLTVT